MDSMALIALVNTDGVSRRALQGARADDPVRPHRPGRLTRIRRALARTPKSDATLSSRPAAPARAASRG
jgi:hypothetical protein